MWPALLAGCLGVYLFKLAGLSVPLAVLQRPGIRRLAALLPIVLLAALIGVQTFGSGRAVSLDARFAGVLVAAVAVWRRAPFLVVIALAVLVTALVRRFLPGS
jgi:hypothetical protein